MLLIRGEFSHSAKLISPSLCLICQTTFCEKTHNLQIEFVVISCSVWELINLSCALQKTACCRVPLLFPLLGLPASRVLKNWWYDGPCVTSFGAHKCKGNHCPVLVWGSGWSCPGSGMCLPLLPQGHPLPCERNRLFVMVWRS